MVARGGSNHGHADFQSRVSSPEALYFNELPGRPLPNLHDNAGRCTTSSRKLHAVYFARYEAESRTSRHVRSRRPWLEEKCARLEGRPDGWATSAADAELSDRAGRESVVLRQDLALLQFNAEQLTKLSPVIARKSAKVRDRRAFRIGVFQSSLHGQQAAHANDHGWAGACD